MGFLHSMTCATEGIQSTAPVQWRSYDGMCGVYWEAQGHPGSTGYYLSPDPRVMVFFNDVSRSIDVSGRDTAAAPDWRPMQRAVFVPAGVPMWTRFGAAHEFSHLDLHMDRRWLLRCLAPLMGMAAAEAALRAPVERQDVGPIEAIARAIVAEIAQPNRAPHFAESLAVALVTGLVQAPPEACETTAQGGLTPHQVRRLRQLMTEGRGRRLSNAELSAAVGLSEGWFCRAFKRTMGKTPHNWQQEMRVQMVKESLRRTDLTIAEIALRHDFSDQGHLTRVFRRHEGTTPSAWRRDSRALPAPARPEG